jgi:AsmA protein
MAPGETGTLRLEGTLGAAETIASLAEIPIDLQGTWQDAQLGGLTSLLLGRDAGLRGGLALNFALQGTIGRNAIIAALDLENARRADFIPARPLSLRAGCNATAESSFHAFTAIECRLPSQGSSGPAMLTVSASVPDVRRPELAGVRLTVPALPAQTLFDWLSVATPHPPTAFSGSGKLTGELAWGAADAEAAEPAGGAAAHPAWSGELTLSGESLSLPALGPDPLPLEDIVLRSIPAETAPTGGPPRARHAAANSAPAQDSFDLLPVSLPLGGKQAATISGNVNDAGYTLHLAGTGDLERLLALGDAIPQFGSGLRTLLAPPTAETPAAADAKPAAPAVNSRGRGGSAPAQPATASAPITFDLTAVRSWGGPQVWTEAQPSAPAAQHHAGTAPRHRR